ncbi:surfeit locus protein 1-like [Oppia nitens]|uniref:surfeit locus protein 1-like n=1 Tax=Oppia nitens TaxID=1686743 RepID=UPI0023DC47C1|nr:surfeit locus protein 1-like [Oppia nitens]
MYFNGLSVTTTKTQLLLCNQLIRKRLVQSVGRRNISSTTKWSSKVSATSYLLLAIPSATFCLGCWQIQRRQWKLDLIDRLEQLTKLSAVDLPEDLDELSELEYRKVKLRGRFDNSMEMYISPRSLLQTEDHRNSSVFSKSTKDSIGVWVITPFELKGKDTRILVNRGWVHRSQMDPKTRPNGQTGEEIELIGIVRNTEKRQPFGLKNDEKSNVWHYRDIEGMARRLNTLPLIFDADYNSTIPGGPIGGQTRVSLRNEHMSYIITWFGLSIITFYLWYLKIYKRKRVF